MQFEVLAQPLFGTPILIGVYYTLLEAELVASDWDQNPDYTMVWIEESDPFLEEVEVFYD